MNTLTFITGETLTGKTYIAERLKGSPWFTEVIEEDEEKITKTKIKRLLKMYNLIVVFKDEITRVRIEATGIKPDFRIHCSK